MVCGYVSDPSNPSMRLTMCKMGGNKRPQPEHHINTNFAFWTDRSPICFDTSEINKDGRFFAVDLMLLPKYKREAQEVLNELLSMRGGIWLLYSEDNFNLFQKATEFAKVVHLLHTGRRSIAKWMNGPFR